MEKYSGSFAKVTPPTLTDIYQRQRLFKLMDRFRNQPVIWISGPAGCGKTTLTSSYVQARDLACLWYQVDPGDADPATFFYYLGLAAEKAAPHHSPPLPALTPEYLLGIEVFSQRFFDNLYRRLKIPGLVVFDNFQEQPAESILLGLLIRSIALLPEGINIVLVSRNSPPPALARMQANRKMQIIDYHNLRLTRQEIRKIAGLHLGKQVQPKVADTLHQRCDGWAAGLILMLEAGTGYSGRSSPHPESLETPQVVFDYFATEVLSRSEKGVQKFLLKTAPVPTISLRLAEALTGMADAGKILSRLNRDSYFITRHVGQTTTYRYHPLFREFLTAQAEEAFPRDMLLGLRRRAGSLLEEEGEIESAADLFMSALDWDALAALIFKHAATFLAQGRFTVIINWLQGFPEKTIQNDPWLLYWQGTSHLYVNPSISRLSFERSYHQFRSCKNAAGILMAWTGVINAIEFQMEDLQDLDGWILEFDQLYDIYKSLPAPEIKAQVASSMLRTLVLRQPHHTDIDKWRKQAFLPPNDPFTANKSAHLMLSLMTHYLENTADIEKAEKLLVEAEKLLTLPFVTPQIRLTVKALKSIFLMILGYNNNIRQTITEALELSRESGIQLYNIALSGYYIGDLLRMNSIKSVKKHLNEMGRSHKSFNKMNSIWYYFIKARVALVTGEFQSAVSNAKMTVDLAEQLGYQITRPISKIFYALTLHATNKPFEADIQLAGADKLIRRHHLKFARLHYLLTRAYFDLEKGQTDRGLKSLHQGLSLGRAIGLIPHMADDPVATTRLCVIALENNIEVEYTRKIIQNRNLVADPPPLHLDSWPWKIRIHMFGAFNLVVDNQPVQFSRKAQQKPLDMLKIIVAFGGRKVREESIADELWPEADGDQAHRSFATTLHRLRKLIGYHKVIRLADHRITLDPRYCWIDTQAFEYLYQQLSAPNKVQPDMAMDEKKIGVFQRIMVLYQGHFLADESWAGRFIVQKEKFHHLFLDVVRRLGRYWETRRQWEKAAACYQQGLNKDPLAENLYGRLMNCLHQLGRTSEALKVYESSKKILSQTLGRSPSREIEAIYEALTNR